ncbi:MAG: thiamine pyrophosphate-binding protein, partial [Spirochaetota bacterium]
LTSEYIPGVVMKEIVADHLVSLMEKQGIKHVFGVPSGGWLPYMDAMRQSEVEFVLVANEASAGFMATVYGWLTGVPGACYATIGPGATNLTTGLGSAYLDRSPVIAFTTEPADAMMDRTVQMAIDQQTLMKPVTKWTTRVQAATIDKTFERAVQVATSELPGPVHLALPEDLWDKEVPKITDSLPAVTPQLGAPGSAQLNQMCKRFSQAKRPLLAVGLTAVRFGLGETISNIAQRHNVPVVLTPMAKGVVTEDDPSYAGVLFHALSDRVAETHRQADLVVGIGYDPVEFNYEQWMPEVELIHIDPIPADIDIRSYPQVTNVTGNPLYALEQLAELDPIQSAWDMQALDKRRKKMFDLMKPSGKGFGPLAALTILREQLPSDGIMTCDVGSHTHLIGQAWQTPHPFGQLMSNGWSSMGFGVPAAIGAKVARPDTSVACITGDGGFMMMAGEMATAARLNLTIVFVVFADRNLELIRIKQHRKGMNMYGTSLGDTSVTVHNSFFGVPVVTATDKETYREALVEAFKREGPTVIEAVIDASEYGDLILKQHK